MEIILARNRFKKSSYQKDNYALSYPEVVKKGQQTHTIYYCTDLQGNIRYLNSYGKKWLKSEQQFDQNLKVSDIKEYFDDEIVLSDTEAAKSSRESLSLCNIWFPNELGFKLCLISRQHLADCPDTICTIRPIEKWDFLKQRFGKILLEENYIADNQSRYNRLTKREVEIVKLITDGLNSRQISEQLFLSRHTVEQHRKNINRKLEVNTIAEVSKYGQLFQ